MSEPKEIDSAARFENIIDLLTTHAELWCKEVNATAGELIVGFLTIAIRSQIVVGKNHAEITDTFARVLLALGVGQRAAATGGMVN